MQHNIFTPDEELLYRRALDAPHGSSVSIAAEDLQNILDKLTSRTAAAREWKDLAFTRDENLRALQGTYAQLSEAYHTLEHRLSSLLQDVRKKFPDEEEEDDEDE